MPKFFFIGCIIIVGFIVGVTFSAEYFLSPVTYYTMKHKILRNGMTAYINGQYGIALEYSDNYQSEKLSDASFSLLGGGDTKPYIIEFQTVPYESFQSWSAEQTWPGNREDYWFSTSTLGQPMMVSDITETLYTLLRPGVLVTIQNALSSEGHYQSDKILMEMADDIKSL